CCFFWWLLLFWLVGGCCFCCCLWVVWWGCWLFGGLGVWLVGVWCGGVRGGCGAVVFGLGGFFGFFFVGGFGLLVVVVFV
ncbi:hypothetical protein, partial [Pseudomonas syringae group genomosp. 7]|uniref:hypothetical protein n=1 Tax=Pseudomonas syringae group genomosp. 7 TaxID=251699 RepID=UPI00377035E1